MKSMTGFGRAEQNSRLGRFTVEIASVNNRFLESSIRLPRPFGALETQIREQVTAAVSRGKVNLSVNLVEPEDAPDKALINMAAAKAYYRQLRQLRKDLGLKDDIAIRDLLLLPEVTRPERVEPDLETVQKLLSKVIAKALKALVAMRAREGKALASDMADRLKTMSTVIGEVERKSAGAVKIYADKLANRIDELIAAPMRDSQRLEEEIAIFADRTDIAEECLRFRSHISQFNVTLKKREAVGRRLNFILQEMNREVNTIGSKCSEFEISADVISLKEEIEKIREQVQNVE
ncbi:MAG: YicC family protein [bacterium]|nr:YicC family protein [bacterium]